MVSDAVKPNGWAVIKLPSDRLKLLKVAPNTTIALGKYGSFPSNLIIGRPFHLTYEVQDRREGENFSRLRVVPGTELNADALADANSRDDSQEAADIEATANTDENVITTGDDEELALVDESGQVIARSKREVLDDSARQTLTADEIEELKQKGTSAGKELIAKLMLSHTAIDQKTAFSLAKYKLLKTKKYIRRFTVLPLDVPLLAQWMLEDKDGSKILEMRNEAMALVGCFADAHFAAPPVEGAEEPYNGRWLVVDDTGGLLVASLAERMGILYPPEDTPEDEMSSGNGQSAQAEKTGNALQPQPPNSGADTEQQQTNQEPPRLNRKRPRLDDLEVPFQKNNTLTLIHHNPQPNLFLLRYFDYDALELNPLLPFHPLHTNLMSLTWLQLLSPKDESAYAEEPPYAEPEVVASWKTNRRGNYHRKRRRWARVHHVIDSTLAGGFSGLAVATTMDPISVLRAAVPLLAGGSPVAVYSQSIEPLAKLVDCFSVGRRTAWLSSPPPEIVGKTVHEMERWEGSEEFPLNPLLLQGCGIQTSRAKRWQVLPGRTHPLMSERGGPDGYVFNAWRVIPVEGRVAARGKYTRPKKS